MTALFHADLGRALLAVAEPARAEPMSAYMRNQFPFLGVPTPARRAAGKSLLRALGELNAEALLAMADELWELPEREYQYVALDMLAMHWKKFNVEHIPELMRLARRKSWWDTVDAMAGIIGDVLRHKHDFMDEAINHEDFWIRRIALLHQLGWRDKTDKALLLGYCLQLAHEQEFFIQKAIGWALRDYARHDPAGVRAFINTNKSLLAPLSYREANKHL